MNDLITQLIVWSSPAVFAVAVWAINNWVSDVKDEITQTKGNVLKVQNDLVEISKSIVKIESDIEYIKKDSDKERRRNDKFENHVVTILREAKKKFE